MSNNFILPDNKLINKLFEKYNLGFYYSKSVIKHMKEFIIASVSKGFSAKTVDISEHSNNHRTTIGHFLSKGVWNEEYLIKIIKQLSLDFALKYSKDNNEPMFIIHDDTVCQKTLPSSQAIAPIEETGFHHSHLLGKTVWGHQLVSTMINCGKHTLINDLQYYNKEEKSKIDIVCDIAASMPKPVKKSYALFDSWYTCPRIINAYAKQGYHSIGAIKTNRIIYPQGIRISISKFAEHIKKSDVRLVTVNGSKYWIYRYEGALNNIENAIIILSWPENAFKNHKALKAFICTDVSLDSTTILEYYSKRWPIEIFFRQTKSLLGLDKYQIRSIKGIKRIWILQIFVHILCTIGLDQPMKFGAGLLKIRTESKREHIKWIYNCAKSNIPLGNIFNFLKIA